MVIFNDAKPKYEKLDELLEVQLQDIRYSNQVNIIVDVKEIAKKYFRPDIILGDNHKLVIEEISSDIINIIAHYRNYFYKKGKYTTFYFLYSFSKCKMMLENYPDYKKEYYSKYFNTDDPKTNIINRAIQVVQKVIDVTPHAIFIDTSKYDEFIYAKYITNHICNKENEITLILSNDNDFFQLINKHTFVLNLKGIKSSLATFETALNILIKKDNVKLTANSIPLVLSIGGSNRIGIKSIPNVALVKATSIVEKLIENGKATDSNSIEVPLEFSKLDSKNKLEKSIIDYKDNILDNYKLIRCDDILYKNKLDIETSFIVSKQLGSSRYFAGLNANIFTSYPLQIDMILKGEKL